MMMEIVDNELFLDGCSSQSLVKQFGTPLIVYSQQSIEKKINSIKEDFLKKYTNTRVAYAAKAFFNLGMSKIIENSGLCIDVVSQGELFVALQAGFPPERIEFNGNNKSDEELHDAIAHGIGRIIVDSYQETDRIAAICKKLNKPANVLYRIIPKTISNTHQFIDTGNADSKFGFPVDSPILLEEIKKAVNSPYIDFYGFHFHIGSQIHDNKTYLQAVDTMLKIVEETKEKLYLDCKELNIGGGFGIAYLDEEKAQPYGYFLDPIMKKIETYFQERQLERPTIVIEPGRSIVGNAAVTLYTIGSIRDIQGIKKYISIDGGMTDNIRPALYQAKYQGCIANHVNKEPKEVVTVCGKCCESSDILIKDILLSKAQPKDVLAVFNTGAYGFSMASNYNKLPRPGVIIIHEGKPYPMVKRETLQQLMENDVIPSYL